MAKGQRPANAWPKGVVQNPGGRPSMEWFHELMRRKVGALHKHECREEIVQALVDIATYPMFEPRDRVQAANILLQYEMGKPRESVEIGGLDGNPLQFAPPVVQFRVVDAEDAPAPAPPPPAEEPGSEE